MSHIRSAHAELATSRIPVRLPPGSSTTYEILISADAFARLGPLIHESAAAAHYAIITDSNVARLHGDRVASSLRGMARVDLFSFPAGEANKTRTYWSELTDRLLDHGIGRDGCIVALGGGVVGDLAGFVAATYMRGIPFVQVPTTLLAMIDASVGGKTGVDTAAGKNLVGAFQHPRLVVIDPVALGTLPDVELRAGVAEAVKHGAIADAQYLASIRERAPVLLGRDPSALAALIHRSVEIKAGVVSRDPVEHGERASLNFGHTIGHALERVLQYSIPHGFAVAIGMAAEAELGELLGVTEPGTAALLRASLEPFGLPTALPGDVIGDDVIAATGSDKKTRDRRIRFALLRRPGETARTNDGAWTFPADREIIALALERTRDVPDSTL